MIIDYANADIRQNLTRKEDKSNKVTSVSSASTNTEYPSAKALFDALAVLEARIAALEDRIQ